MIKKVIFLFLFVTISITLIAQNDSTSNPILQGKVFGRIFANFYTGLGKDNQSSAFELRRAYFGYNMPINNEFSAEVKLDIGSPNDISEYSRIRRYAYFKTAAVYYLNKNWYVKMGIFDIDHFMLQETIWNHRYIYKSFQDEHRFGDKADLGVSVHYHFTNSVSADITIINGEGYTNIQSDNAFKTGLGVTFNPLQNWVIRAFADYMERSEKQSTLSFFTGYTKKPILAGVEYNYKFNKDYYLDHDQTGISAYLSYQINQNFELFGRYDLLRSNIMPEDTNPWNIGDDGSAIISGVQFQPVKGIKFALNYQDWYPYASNLQDESFIFINLEARF